MDAHDDDFPEFAQMMAKYLSEKEKTGNSEGEEELSLISAKLSHEELSDCLLNVSGNVTLPARFRALFALRNLADDQAVEIIGNGTKLYYIFS